MGFLQSSGRLLVAILWLAVLAEGGDTGEQRLDRRRVLSSLLLGALVGEDDHQVGPGRIRGLVSGTDGVVDPPDPRSANLDTSGGDA